MTRISILLFKTYIGPFIITFMVALFIFEMQFIWVYLDDLMGKGLGFGVIGQLLIYASARLVSMALPLAILMSAIMSMGSMSEYNELTAMKTSGVSLLRIIRPLIVFHILLSIGAFLFANNVWPMANLKFRSLLYSIVQQRPTLKLEAGVFYNGIDGFSIRVKNNNRETGELTDVLIYDHRDISKGNRTVITAKSGKMEQTEDQRFLVMTLFDGSSYDEQPEKKKKKSLHKYPLIKGSFEKMILRLDLSAFTFQNNSEELFKNSYDMMTINQLDLFIDSLQTRMDTVKDELATIALRSFHFRPVPDSIAASPGWYLDHFNTEEQLAIVEKAKEKNRQERDALQNKLEDIEGRERFMDRHRIEWHRKFFFAIACLVMFFIGAPLGAIIRKGGLGLPTIIALIIFVVYQLLTIAGEKMTKSGLLEPWIGMWISSVLILPLGIFLTYKAANDSALVDRDVYLKYFDKILRFLRIVNPAS